MNFSSPRNRSNDLGLVLLVNQSELRLLVFEYSADKTATVIYAKNNNFLKRANAKVDKQFVSLVGAAVYKLIHGFSVDYLKRSNKTLKINSVSVYIAPPLSVFFSQQIHLHSNNTDCLGENQIQEIVTKTEKEFLSDLQERSKKEYGGVLSYEIIERRLFNARIEGYPVSQFIYKQYKDFSASLSFTAVPQNMVAKIIDSIHSVFRNTSITFHTTLQGIMETLSLTCPDLERYFCFIIFPDVSVSIYVGNYERTEQLLFGNGAREIELNLAKNLSSTRSIVRSYVTLYKSGSLHGKSENQFKKAFYDSAISWLLEALKTRQKMTELLVLPKTIYIVTCDETDSSLLKEAYAAHREFQTEYHLFFIDKENTDFVKSVESITLSPLDCMIINHVMHHYK